MQWTPTPQPRRMLTREKRPAGCTRKDTEVPQGRFLAAEGCSQANLRSGGRAGAHGGLHGLIHGVWIVDAPEVSCLGAGPTAFVAPSWVTGAQMGV